MYATTVVIALWLTATATASSAAITAISSIALEVKLMDNEMVFQMTMSVAKQALNNDLITKDIYLAFYREMVSKYTPTIGALLFDVDLL